MTTGELLLNLGVLAFVLISGLGTRPLNGRRFRLPIAIVVVVGLIFLRNVPTSGNDVTLEVILGILGVAFGGLAGSFMAVSRDSSTGSLITRAGAPYAIAWIAVIGARIFFSYGAKYLFANQIVTFSEVHSITGSSAWTAALVIMALAMVVTRVCVTGIKAAHHASPSQFLARQHHARSHRHGGPPELRSIASDVDRTVA
jgi:hypothetical protein